MKKNFLNIIKFFSETSPYKVCLQKGNKKINYREFWNLSLKFSQYLKNKSNSKIPIVCIVEQEDFIDYIAMIGTLLSGGYYIPINKITPKIKILEIFEQTKSNFIVTNLSSLKKNIKEKKIINIKKMNNFESGKVKIRNSEIAYILFTSGTTGYPKGVIIKKSSLNHYINWLVKKIALKKNSNCSQIPSIGFDLSVADIFLSLCSGSRLIIPEYIDKIFPARWFLEKQINHVVCTPSTIDFIFSSKQLNKKNFKYVKSIFFCGEPLYFRQVKKIFSVNKSIHIINAYGPTEATCSMTYSDINFRNYHKKCIDTISIGKCIPGMKIKLDNKLKYEDKKIGEILISGKQLSTGYFRQKKLTKEKFIKSNRKIFYKTGDLGFIKNNQLYFYSRIDNQIKIRGFRVELSEIDYHIRKFGSINSVSIFVDNKIISFVDSKKISSKRIINYLNKKLESYKIPSDLVTLKSFPINKNGKIDVNYLTKKYLKNEI